MAVVIQAQVPGPTLSLLVLQALPAPGLIVAACEDQVEEGDQAGGEAQLLHDLDHNPHVPRPCCGKESWI